MFNLEVCVSRLVDLRKDKKISQEQIGEILNLSKQAINEIEKGRNKISLGNACLLADFYGVSLDYLVGQTDIKELAQNSTEKILSKEEESIINTYRKLDDISKGRLIERSRILLESSEKIKNKNKNEAN